MAECGTNSSYVSGCHCDKCREAHNEYARKRAKMIAQEKWGGRPATRVPIAEAKEVFERLLAKGYSAKEISRCTGLSRTVIQPLSSGFSYHTGKKSEFVWRSTLDALLEVERSGKRSIAKGQYVSRVPFMLMVDDWEKEFGGMTKVSRATGLDLHFLNNFKFHPSTAIKAETAVKLLKAKERIDAAKKAQRPNLNPYQEV